ncbi:MAG: FUSC family protein [Chitinophagaceae bacterium]|nr:FUSC family protein [Chitinophagaceae bacterium]
MLSWGIRMTIAVIVPLFYGLYTHRSADAMWIIVAAESICWVELKGSFAQRVRILLGGAFLALVFGFAGCISSGHLWLSLLLMLVVVFIASLFKNLGERGSGLSLAVYVMFITANAYPVADFNETIERCGYILIGGAWTFVVGTVASLFMSEQTPYKRSIAFIWKSTASLADVIDKGWDGRTQKAGIREVYLKEKEVNAAIESSLQLYDKRAYHNNHDSENAHLMAQLRRTVYLTSATLMTLAEELDNIKQNLLTGEQKQSIHAILKSIAVICERMTIYTVTSKPEEEILLRSRIIRLHNMIALLRESDIPVSEQRSVKYVLHFTGRIVRFVEEGIGYINSVGGDRKVYRSYSLMKTLLILHHRHWINSIRRLANVNTHSFRYALRTALVATLALFIYQWFHIDHGYWLPFTVMIVTQPYFGATLKKALDRVLGTVSGVVAGGLLLALPADWHSKEVLLIVSPVLMVYFLRKQYSVATFFISVFLVALFAAENSLETEVILTRALCTVGGAALAVVGEFALLPTWDKDWLPRHLADAIHANYQYFLFTCYPNHFSSIHQWTHYRRIAESANSNAFDSFNRYLQEPTSKDKEFSLYYQMISHCIRITRELNNYHIEMDVQKKNVGKDEFVRQKKKIFEFLEQFNEIERRVKKMNWDRGHSGQELLENVTVSYIPLNETQSLYLDKLGVELNAFVRDMQKWEER